MEQRQELPEPTGAVVSGLEALPLPLLALVVRRVVETTDTPCKDSEVLRGVLRGLPCLSKGMLAALQNLRLPIGRLRTRTVKAAVQQATNPRNAWDICTLDLSHCSGVTDVSALAGCAALHTLNLSWCSGVTDVSALAGIHVRLTYFE